MTKRLTIEDDTIKHKPLTFEDDTTQNNPLTVFKGNLGNLQNKTKKATNTQKISAVFLTIATTLAIGALIAAYFLHADKLLLECKIALGTSGVAGLVSLIALATIIGAQYSKKAAREKINQLFRKQLENQSDQDILNHIATYYPEQIASNLFFIKNDTLNKLQPNQKKNIDIPAMEFNNSKSASKVYGSFMKHFDLPMPSKDNFWYGSKHNFKQLFDKLELILEKERIKNWKENINKAYQATCENKIFDSII